MRKHFMTDSSESLRLIFDDLSKKALEDVRSALQRNANLVALEEPQSNAAEMLMIGTLSAAYETFARAMISLVNKDPDDPRASLDAAAMVAAFDGAIIPVMNDMRLLVQAQRERGGDVAEAIVTVDSKADIFKKED